MVSDFPDESVVIIIAGNIFGWLLSGSTMSLSAVAACHNLNTIKSPPITDAPVMVFVLVVTVDK